MDFNRLWFKAQYGFNAQEQPRSSTACQWVLKKGEPLLIRDAGQDQRFPPEGIPLIGAEPCRSYAGTPLITSAQQVVGTMALLAREPNKFSQEHLTFLEVLGRQAVTGLNSTTASAPGASATRPPADGARAGHRTMLCGRYTGLDPRVGCRAGHRGPRGEDE